MGTGIKEYCQSSPNSLGFQSRYNFLQKKIIILGIQTNMSTDSSQGHILDQVLSSASEGGGSRHFSRAC